LGLIFSSICGCTRWWQTANVEPGYLDNRILNVKSTLWSLIRGLDFIVGIVVWCEKSTTNVCYLSTSPCIRLKALSSFAIPPVPWSSLACIHPQFPLRYQICSPVRVLLSIPICPPKFLQACSLTQCRYPSLIFGKIPGVAAN